MVWHFIGVYIINRTLRDRLEIRNFSSRVEKYFTRSRNIFQHSKRNIVSPRGHVISSIYSDVVLTRSNCTLFCKNTYNLAEPEDVLILAHTFS